MPPPDRIDLLGVLFDMDGTLTRPMMNFKALKQRIGLSAEADVLLDLMKLPEKERKKALVRIEAMEVEAAKRAEASDGAVELMRHLQERGLHTFIHTRNSRACLETTLERLGIEVDFSVTREDAAPKPAPEGVLEACRLFHIPPEHLLVVGDFKYDIEAGRAAGARTALVTRGRKIDFDCHPDFIVKDLVELRRIIQDWV